MVQLQLNQIALMYFTLILITIARAWLHYAQWYYPFGTRNVSEQTHLGRECFNIQRKCETYFPDYGSDTLDSLNGYQIVDSHGFRE